MHWSVASGPWCSCQHRPAVLSSPTFVFLESSHRAMHVWQCVRRRPLIKQTTARISHSFSHTYIASTLRRILVGLYALHRWRLAWLGGGRHVYHTLLTSTPRTVQRVLYRPTCVSNTVMAIYARWRQAAYARSCCILLLTIGPMTVRAGTTNQIRIRVQISETKFEFYQKKNEFNIPRSNAGCIWWTTKCLKRAEMLDCYLNGLTQCNSSPYSFYTISAFQLTRRRLTKYTWHAYTKHVFVATGIEPLTKPVNTYTV